MFYKDLLPASNRSAVIPLHHFSQRALRSEKSEAINILKNPLWESQNGWNASTVISHSPACGLVNFHYMEEQNVEHTITTMGALTARLWLNVSQREKRVAVNWLLAKAVIELERAQKWEAGRPVELVTVQGGVCVVSSEWKKDNRRDMGTIDNILVQYQLCYLLPCEVGCVCVCVRVWRFVKQRVKEVMKT